MQSMQITCMALLLAHLLGDFPFQSRWMNHSKGHRLSPLLCHGFAHYLLAWICLAIFSQVSFFSLYNQSIMVGYLLLHLTIDRTKSRLTARKTIADNSRTFLLDQALHMVVLAIAALILSGNSLHAVMDSIRLPASTKAYILETAVVYVAVIFGGGYLIRYLTRAFADKNAATGLQDSGNTGMYVGWIERFLVITAMVMQSPVLVGLILTGKSIARFPEFKEARFAEYFLVGTLLSISLSVMGGLILLQLLYGTISLK